MPNALVFEETPKDSKLPTGQAPPPPILRQGFGWRGRVRSHLGNLGTLPIAVRGRSSS